jgi:hypothetical protein
LACPKVTGVQTCALPIYRSTAVPVVNAGYVISTDETPVLHGIAGQPQIKFFRFCLDAILL